MLSKERQIKYIKKSWHKLEKQFQIFCDSSDQEALHKLRLEIKKIDSFIFLISKGDPGKKFAMHFKPVRKLFKHAGIIRSANLNLQLAEKHTIGNQAFLDGQKGIIDGQIKNFLSHRKMYSSHIRKSYKKITENLVSLDDKYIENIYLHQYNKTKHFISGENYGENLHTYRKKVKFLIYTYHLLNKSIRNEIKPEIPCLDILQNSIGAWHDYVLSVEIVKANNPESIQVIQLLEEQIQNVLVTIHSIAREIELKTFPYSKIITHHS